MKRLISSAALLCLVATGAQAMTVAEFLAKARALQAKGAMALFSSDLKLLKGEMQAVASAYRSDIVAARGAGRAPHSCPPPKGQVKMGSKELLDELERIPVAERRMSMKQAFYDIMKRRYPCG